MNTTITKPAACPACRYMMDRATLVKDAPVFETSGANFAPVPGSITLCINCGAILEFTADMGLTPLRDDVWDSLPPHRRDFIQQASRLIKEVLEREGALKDSFSA